VAAGEAPGQELVRWAEEDSCHSQQEGSWGMNAPPHPLCPSVLFFCLPLTELSRRLGDKETWCHSQIDPRAQSRAEKL
jgi:hypothetical protein